MQKKILSFLFMWCFLSANAQPQAKPTDSILEKVLELQLLASENPAKATAGLKKLKKYSEQVKHTAAMQRISNTLMMIYYNGGDYKAAIEESLYTEKVSKELKEMLAFSDLYRMRALAYGELNFPEQALKELQKALAYAQKIPNEERRLYRLSLVYEGYAGAYSKLKNFKKEIEWRHKSIEVSKKMSEDEDRMMKAKYHNLGFQYASLGLVYNDLKVKDSALFYFEEALKIHQNEKYSVYTDAKATLLSDMALFYVSNKEFRKAIQFAKRAEAFEKEVNGLPYIRRSIYESLFNSYVETDKKDSSKYYLKLYKAINDSILKVEKAALYTPVKQIIKDNETENTNKVRNIVAVGGAALLVILLLGWFFWKRSDVKTRKSYEALLEKLKAEKELMPILSEPILEDVEVEQIISKQENDVAKEAPFSINNNTVSTLLHKLEKFEKSAKYVKAETSLTNLATQLGTNTKYLSEVIKQHRGKTYNNYINGLRIDYIVRLLFEDPKVREYKISYLAELCGFSSREVFAVIFKKETGFTPSFYIENLKKEKSISRVV